MKPLLPRSTQRARSGYRRPQKLPSVIPLYPRSAFAALRRDSASRVEPKAKTGEEERAGVRGEGLLTEISVSLQRRSPLTLNPSPLRGEGKTYPWNLYKLRVRFRWVPRAVILALGLTLATHAAESSPVKITLDANAPARPSPKISPGSVSKRKCCCPRRTANIISVRRTNRSSPCSINSASAASASAATPPIVRPCPFPARPTSTVCSRSPKRQA